MNKHRIHLVAAARPNFMKIAPLYHAMKRSSVLTPVIVHTGQHYDPGMSESFFRDLDLPDPDFNLEVGSGTHAEQTSGVMLKYEKLLLDDPPAWTIVVGDVNSTLACTIAAKKLNRQVAHLEAGLRSFDRTMPEEINRLVTDALSDLLWTPSADADRNLLNEGVEPSRIEMVGNVMIDSLNMMMPKITLSPICDTLDLQTRGYGVVTLHRPANVDDDANQMDIIRVLISISKQKKLVWPVHPRTKKRLAESKQLNDLTQEPGILLTDPLSYIAFVKLVCNSSFVITDSGGVQEETTYLGIPCITLRENTERPITIEMGTNRLSTIDTLEHEVKRISNSGSRRLTPPLWDGQTADRVLKSLMSFL